VKERRVEGEKGEKLEADDGSMKREEGEKGGRRYMERVGGGGGNQKGVS